MVRTSKAAGTPAKPAASREPAASAPVSSQRHSSSASEAAHKIFIGTSGWAYPSWKPGFYPACTGAKTMLAFYAAQLNSVEVNHSFRKLPTAKAIAEWLSRTGPEFRLSFKAPQRITHFSRLRDAGAFVQDFLAALEPVRSAGRLGLILFQLPPNFKADPALLDGFLALPDLQSTAPEPLRLAFEFRHPGWFTEPTYAVLRAHGAAMCIAESDELATPEIHTAPAFTAYRLRRAGGYTSAAITAMAARFHALADDAAAPRTVYAYLKHEDEPTGALNAVALRQALAARRAR